MKQRLSSKIIIFTIMVIALGFTPTAQAQSALDGFDPNANGSVETLIVQADGKILIGGTFTALAPNGGASVTRNRIARLNPDGTLDTAFNPNANNTVFALAEQADGKILAGGIFTNIGGQTRFFLARLDAVTGLADGFNPSADGVVQAMAVQADGGILVGGTFANIGGQPRNRIARLNATTGLADAFDPNASADINKIVVQSDGKILVGGAFMNIGGQTRNRIARLDATTGLADSFNPNASGIVYGIAVQADGKVVAGGAFINIGGQTRNRIARLDAVTGAADSFNPNSSNFINTIAIQPDGKIVAAGFFTTIGGQPRNNIARLDPTTGLADGFNPNVNTAILTIGLQADGRLIIGGPFATLTPNGGAAITRNRIARLEPDGRADRTVNDLNLGGDAKVIAIAVQPDGKILIGGTFNSVLGSLRDNIARLNTDGTLDTTFRPDADNTVTSIAVQADGRVLAGGLFTGIGSQTRIGIARLNALTGQADSFDPNGNGNVLSIAVQADGKIIIGGNFTSIGGQARSRIARLNPTTGLADSFNPISNGGILTIALQADGKVLVGGSFTTMGGQPRSCIARLDPVVGAVDSFNPATASAARVDSILVQPDGKILVGGVFTSMGGQARNHIARLDAANGMADSFNPNANGQVGSVVLQEDGKVLVSGFLFEINGQSRRKIARLDHVTGLADSFNPDANFDVYAMAVQSDGKILVGGLFSSIGGQARAGFARLGNDTVATQNLAVSQIAITWTRGGSSPAFSRVTFEDSTDGINYNFLGNGTISGTNATLTCLNLSTSQNIYIRARGYYRSGSNSGSESIQESVRNAFLAPIAITGTVTYGNAIGAPTPRFVSNVLLTGAGSPTVMTTTAAPGPCAGTYSLSGFGAGSYTVTPTKPGGPNTSINSFDAARVAQGVSGTVPFVSQNQRFAADASGNGNVTSNDAALIARFAAGLTGAGNAGQWKFFVTGAPSPLPTPPQTYDDSRSYASVTSSVTGEDFVALLVGEVSGNYNPATHPRPAGRVESGKWKVDSEDGGPERGIAVELPKVATPLDKEIVVPVNVQGVADEGVISYEFNLRYDPADIQPQENPVDVAGTVSRGLMVVANPYEPGLLRVVVYGPLPINENGVLLNLRFAAVGSAGATSTLTFEGIMFNEGDPISLVTDGKIELLSASSN